MFLYSTAPKSPRAAGGGRQGGHRPRAALRDAAPQAFDQAGRRGVHQGAHGGRDPSLLDL